MKNTLFSLVKMKLNSILGLRRLSLCPWARHLLHLACTPCRAESSNCTSKFLFFFFLKACSVTFWIIQSPAKPKYTPHELLDSENVIFTAGYQGIDLDENLIYYNLMFSNVSKETSWRRPPSVKLNVWCSQSWATHSQCVPLFFKVLNHL